MHSTSGLIIFGSFKDEGTKTKYIILALTSAANLAILHKTEESFVGRGTLESQLNLWTHTSKIKVCVYLYICYSQASAFSQML